MVSTSEVYHYTLNILGDKDHLSWDKKGGTKLPHVIYCS